MKNVLIIALIIVSMAYMVSIMVNKYETIKNTNNEISKNK